MRFFIARRLVFAALIPALLVVIMTPGCSNESEGERCGDSYQDPNAIGTPNNDDCQDGLICVEAALLVNNQANRCCNANASIVNDDRCIRAGGVNSDAGTSNPPSDDSDAGTSSAGASSTSSAGASSTSSAGASGAGGN